MARKKPAKKPANEPVESEQPEAEEGTSLDVPPAGVEPVPRAIHLTIKQRVEEVLEICLMGGTLADIRRHAADPAGDGDPNKAWGVCDRQLKRYIESADALMMAQQEKNRAKLLSRHYTRRERLYSRSVAVSDYRTALAVLQDTAKLEDLYPSAKHEHTGAAGGAIKVEVVDLSKVTDEELETLERIALRAAVEPPVDPPGESPPEAD